MTVQNTQQLAKIWVDDVDDKGAMVQPDKSTMSDLTSTAGSVNWASSRSDTSDVVGRISICDDTLTREQIMALCAELLAGFSTTDFQEQMQALLKRKSVHGYVPGRSELALTVQSRILPRYGLPGTAAGVNMMLEVVAPFLGDTMVNMLLDEIDEKLGLPRKTTANTMCIFHNKKPADTQVIDADSDSTSSDCDNDVPPLYLTKAQVVALTSELLEAFSAQEFQEQLNNFPRIQIDGDGVNLAGVPELAVEEVYNKTIPKYGFPGTAEGVTVMCAAIAPFVFMGDFLVGHLLESIDNKLGLTKNATANLCARSALSPLPE